MPHDDQLNLKMNTPPSFRNPKSVLVIGLPSVEAPKLPPLKPVDPKGVYCLSNSLLVLPAEGAPLVFSTKLAHGMDLHVWSKSGKSMDLPARADAVRGGFVVDTSGVKSDDLGSEVEVVRCADNGASILSRVRPFRCGQRIRPSGQWPPPITALWWWAVTTRYICNPTQQRVCKTLLSRTTKARS